eukprot:scaffold280534_cov16-Tisochrysis_lutea.AAC.1
MGQVAVCVCTLGLVLKALPILSCSLRTLGHSQVVPEMSLSISVTDYVIMLNYYDFNHARCKKRSSVAFAVAFARILPVQTPHTLESQGLPLCLATQILCFQRGLLLLKVYDFCPYPSSFFLQDCKLLELATALYNAGDLGVEGDLPFQAVPDFSDEELASWWLEFEGKPEDEV